MLFYSKVSGLKIIMEPRTFRRNQWGDKQTVPGKSIRFERGIYDAKDDKEIAFLKQYMDRYGTIYIMDEENVDLVKLIQKAVASHRNKDGVITLTDHELHEAVSTIKSDVPEEPKPRRRPNIGRQGVA